MLIVEIALLVCTALLLVSAVTVLVVLRRWRRVMALDTQRVFEQLDLVRGELLLLGDQVAGLASPEAQPPLRAVLPATGPRGYETAARLARAGATCAELMSGCGLSRHEAELLLRIHKAEVERLRIPGTPASPELRPRLSAVG